MILPASCSATLEASSVWAVATPISRSFLCSATAICCAARPISRSFLFSGLSNSNFFLPVSFSHYSFLLLSSCCNCNLLLSRSLSYLDCSFLIPMIVMIATSTTTPTIINDVISILKLVLIYV